MQPTDSSPPIATQASDQPAASAAALEQVRARLQGVREQTESVILGQGQVIEQMLITLLCGGHALLEGVPGVAKTLTVRVLGASLSCRVKRIQFTPDLMPSDILGTNVYNLETRRFEMHQGPVFTDLLLADEINRAPAKTQSALLEAMSESHATLDGTRHQLSPAFTVFATQNPVEYEGTYPLPEAQQDRFLLKIKVGYPARDHELALLEAVDGGRAPDRLEDRALPAILSMDDLLAARAALPLVRVEPGVRAFVLAVVRATREHPSVWCGAGPRGSIALLLASKARALLHGRDFVNPDDVVAMAEPVLAHRISLASDAEVGGATAAQVIRSILDAADIPR